MIQSIRSIVLASLLIALVLVPVYAQASGPPVADVFVDSNNPDNNYNGQDLRIQGSSGPGGGCDPVRTVFMKWDLSGQLGETATAVLTLTTTNVTSQAAGQTITLYELADDSWTEDVTFNTFNPTLGAEIQSVNLPNPVPAGTQVVFDNGNLVNWVNSQFNGDQVMSVALRFATCAATSLQAFEDRESGVNGPDLQLEDPNAVGLRSLGSDDNPITPLIFAALGLGVLALGGAVVARRRMAS